MPRGGRVTITARQRIITPNDRKAGSLIGAGRFVELRVSDTGVGMTSEVQSRIFEPFYTTKGVGEGTGLGLATAYGIVRQLGGDISVESDVGRGTTFSILLPATDEPADPIVAPTSAVAVPAGRNSRGTVLVAEDEPSVRSITVRALREKGFEVLPAVDGEDAVRIVRAHRGPIDFLVSDLVMPRMGGVQLATTLQSLGHVPRILFITGYAEGGELDAAGEVQGAGVLVKPFPPSTLLASIEELAGGRAKA
jgi:CheY-like chemotaxis protein